jgi:hypothetical protein
MTKQARTADALSLAEWAGGAEIIRVLTRRFCEKLPHLARRLSDIRRGRHGLR